MRRTALALGIVMRAATVMLVLAAASRVARAGDDLIDDDPTADEDDEEGLEEEVDDPGAMVAHLECTVDGVAIVAGKKASVRGDLRCAVVVDDKPAKVKAHASAWVTQGGAESRIIEGIHAKAKVTGYTVEGAFTRMTDFQPCKELVVHAQVAIDDEVLWVGELPIKAACKKVKKVKAKLTCAYYDVRGNAFAFPGKKKQKAPMIIDVVACEVHASKLKKPGDLMVRLSAGGDVHVEALYADDARRIVDWQVLFPYQDFAPCQVLTVVAAIVDPDGQAAWSGKLSVGKACPNISPP